MKFSIFLTLCLCLISAFYAQSAFAVAKVIILSESFPKSSQRFYATLKDGIAKSDLHFEETNGTALAAHLKSETGPNSILVLPNARYFPTEAKQELEAFLKRGNHLLAISGPAFKNMVCRVDNQWLTRDLAKVELGYAPGEKIIDFAQQDMNTWKRVSGSMDNPTTYNVEPSGDPEVPDALHVKISRLDNWDTIVSSPIEQPFPPGFDTTVFWAKGGPDTPEMAIEWREKDGSRWIGVVKLTTEWVRYVLTPDDFKYWPDNPSKGRGGSSDRFNPANAQIISLGLATGITKQEAGKSYEFWIADIKAVKNKFASEDFNPPVLESLSPAYKTHRTIAAKIELAGTTRQVPVATEIVSPIFRAPGFGSDAARKYRFVPVLRALDENGELRGAAAHLFVNAADDYAGSVWGFVGFDQDFLDRTADQTVPLVVDMLKRMNHGVFFINAGVDKVAYIQGESSKCGAYVINLGSEPTDVHVEWIITSGNKVVSKSNASANVAPNRGNQPAFLEGNSLALPPGEYKVSATLYSGETPIDEISYEFRVLTLGSPKDEDVVSVRNGDFYLAGRKWYALGMNYWPTYTGGMEHARNWVHWLEPEQYNPEIVERDLALAEKLRINLLSIQYLKTSQAPAMMDFLTRCAKHGIKVHAYIPGLHPLNHDPALAESLIKAAHLPESSAFFAYDVGWEVHIGKYERRKPYDPLWQKWVIDLYGSLESAERDWGFKPERSDGVITGPTDNQLSTDGSWRVFVAAYRRFWDDEISKRYLAVRETIKRIDKKHLICARSGYGGTGSLWAVQFFPFDLASGAKHLDFTSPEAYALGGDRSGFLKGGLITIYGRHVSGGKPVFWAEYGTSIWPNCDEKELERERQYYENMLYMTLRSYANGSAGWWWPGGFRQGENSDFGIINPDGTPRPAALEIQKIAKEFLKPREIPKPDVFFTYDRDIYVTGFAGVYEALSNDYVKAVESGKNPGLKTEATGKTSADVPLIAIGNVPYNGKNPPKYLNAEFNYLKINNQEVNDGDTLEIERGKPVYVEASVGNLAEPTWLAPKNTTKGGVYLIGDSPRYGKLLFPIKADTPFLQDADIAKHILIDRLETETTFTFRMLARDRAEFGEVIRVTLKPRQG